MATLSLRDTITDPANLHEAWRKVKANGGGPGTDSVRLADFEDNLTENLADLRRRLRSETYVPLPLRYASLPKKNDPGATRALAIPAVADRVAQRAFVQGLQPVFEPLFLPCSFGYRTGLGVADAVERVLAYRNAGLSWVVDADITDFFGSLDHDLLRQALRRHIPDTWTLRGISLWLEAGALPASGNAREPQSAGLLTQAGERVRAAAMALAPLWNDEDGCDEAGPTAELARRWGREAMRLAWENRRIWLPLISCHSGPFVAGGLAVAAVGGAVWAGTRRGAHSTAALGGKGAAQGGPLSPLLSNVYLHEFDREITGAGLRLVRYADDFVICAASQARANAALTRAEDALTRLKLGLHPQKTRVLSWDDPLRFLGHEFDGDGAFAVASSKHTFSPAVSLEAKARCHTAPQATQTVLRSRVNVARRTVGEVQSDVSERWREIRATPKRRKEDG